MTDRFVGETGRSHQETEQSQLATTVLPAPAEPVFIGLHHLKGTADLLDYDLPPGPIWVHFDTDVIDAGEAPAMNYPVKGGPGLDDLLQVFTSLADSGQIVAVSVSTWNPDLDIDGQSKDVVMELLATLVQQHSEQ